MANANLKSVTDPSVSATPQTQKAAPGQKKNNAGGYTFTVDSVARGKRFLILGSDKSFYQAGQTLSKENAANLVAIAESSEAISFIDHIVEVSLGGRAPKQSPALFALAVFASYGSPESKGYALSKLPAVARTASALFEFISYATQFRGWGRAFARAVATWYTEKDVDKLSYQVVKYRQRESWTHRDVFRQAHPVTTDPAFQALGAWILRGELDNAPALVQGFTKAQAASVKDLPALIREYGLSWEMIPTEGLKNEAVWNALLDGNVPYGALLRNLSRLTKIGILAPIGGRTAKITARLTDAEEIKRARVHPLAILTALKSYELGYSLKGGYSYYGRQREWTPVPRVLDALNEAFYKAFDNAEATGLRYLLATDISGSMGSPIGGNSPLSSAEAVAAIALSIMKVEPEAHLVGFASSVIDLGVTPSMRLDDVLKRTVRNNFGSTNCAAAIQYATKMGFKVDVFVVFTDNETYAGNQHVHEALAEYRRKTGLDSKLIVLATTATKFTIADPNDPGMLDMAGFDSAAPRLIAEFSKGF